jgi:hypothetical protein
MARITFTATAPDNTVVTRESTTKTYTHAILAEKDGSWGALGWSGSAALAEKAALTWRNRGHENVTIVEASVKPKRTAAAKTNVEVDGVVVAKTTRTDLTAAADAKPAAAKKTPAKKAERAPKVDAASTPERKAERKLVEKRRAAGESWAAIAKDLGMSPMGLRNRYIDLVPAKDAK